MRWSVYSTKYLHKICVWSSREGSDPQTELLAEDFTLHCGRFLRKVCLRKNENRFNEIIFGIYIIHKLLLLALFEYLACVHEGYVICSLK